MAIGVKDSNIVDILEGEFDGAPQSRVEKILVAKAKGEEYTGPILSRVEYLLNESGGGGTGGVDLPIFTLNFNTNELDNAVFISGTCDHSFSECQTLAYDMPAALANWNQNTGDPEPITDTITCNFVGSFSNDDSNWITYKLFGGEMFVMYYSDGHIEFERNETEPGTGVIK